MLGPKYNTVGFIQGLVLGITLTVVVTYYIHASGEELQTVHVPQTQVKQHLLPGAETNSRQNLFGSNSGNITSTVDPDNELDNAAKDDLYNKVRVLCWIMTSPKTLLSKALPIKETWSGRCNVRLFMSSAEDKDFPAIGLLVEEGREHLYEKSMGAFEYAYTHYKDKVDWFLKADDDTFVVVENLRYLLKDYDPSQPIYFGRKFKKHVTNGYMSGGAGYVLSKEATKRLVEDGIHGLCKEPGGAEDVQIGRCLHLLGVTAGDSRDPRKKETFHPFAPKFHTSPNKKNTSDFWYWDYNYYQTCSGKGCVTDYPITFHYVDPEEMYVLNYMMYNASVHGLADKRLRTKLPGDI